GLTVVGGSADQGRVTVCGERDAGAEFAFSDMGEFPFSDVAGADEFWSLLGPGRAREGEHPGRPRVAGVVARTDQRRAAVGRERNAVAESAESDRARAGEFRALLDEGIDPQ